LAIDDQELVSGVYAIAVPVRDESRDVVAAVGLATYSDAISLERFIDALSPHLISTADSISARLGYRPGDETS
jgi:DNA-binding IclR family transcriptional regulator